MCVEAGNRKWGCGFEVVSSRYYTYLLPSADCQTIRRNHYPYRFFQPIISVSDFRRGKVVTEFRIFGSMWEGVSSPDILRRVPVMQIFSFYSTQRDKDKRTRIKSLQSPFQHAPTALWDDLQYVSAIIPYDKYINRQISIKEQINSDR